MIFNIIHKLILISVFSVLNADFCDFIKPGQRELFPHGLELTLFNILEKGAQVLRTRSEFLLLVASSLFQILAPSILFPHYFLSKIECTCSNHTRAILEHFVLNQRQLDKIPSQVEHKRVCSGYLAKPLNKAISGGDVDVEVSRTEHRVLHVQDLSFGVGSVGDVHEVLYLGSIDFFVFRSDEHGCDSYQLQSGSLDVVLFEISVDQVDCQEQSFWEQFELEVNINKPIYKNSSHFFIDVMLDAHIFWRSNVQLFLFQHVLTNFLSVLSYILRILNILFVDGQETFQVFVLKLVEVVVRASVCSWRVTGKELQSAFVFSARLVIL